MLASLILSSLKCNFVSAIDVNGSIFLVSNLLIFYINLKILVKSLAKFLAFFSFIEILASFDMYFTVF